MNNRDVLMAFEEKEVAPPRETRAQWPELP